MKKTPKTRPTLGLAMIMKDEVEDLERIIHECGEYFDKIYITATRKDTHATLHKKIAAKHPAYKKVQLSYFEWIDHFGKARNYNLSQVKTDYWMAIDPDDEIEGAENLPDEVENMAANNLDVVWFQFETFRRESLSEPSSFAWRERIVKKAPNLGWSDVAVHETLDESIQGEIKEELHSKVIVKNRKTAKQMLVSLDRNRLILEKDWQKSPSAVTGYYLGGTLAGSGDYDGAIEKLSYATKHSDIKPIKFGSWKYLFDCYYQTGNYDAALAASNEGISIDPDHPEPWYQKFTVYRALGFHNAAMYSAETAMSKRIQGNLEIVSNDPSWYQYRGPFEIARAYLDIGNIERAFQLYSEVKKIAPQYIDELSTATGVNWNDTFEQAHSAI